MKRTYGGMSKTHVNGACRSLALRARSSTKRCRHSRLHRSEMYLLKSLMLSMPVIGLVRGRGAVPPRVVAAAHFPLGGQRAVAPASA